MKLNKFIIASAVVLFLSCDEERLDLLPEIGSPLETIIETEDDMKDVLTGVYDRMSSASTFGANILIFGDLVSDNTFVSNDNDNYFVNTSNLNWSPEISDFSQFDGLYDVIQQANIVINNKTLIETPQVIAYKAEAKIARAMANFYLVSFYCSTPTSNVYQDYGIPLLVGEYDPNLKLPRSSVSDVYNLIISDLQFALANMPDSPPVNKGFLSTTAAKLLLSRVYLTRGQTGDYQQALNYATEVISSTSSAFNFVSKDDYVAYFNSSDLSKSENQPETVFEINFTQTDNPGLNAAISTFYHRTGSHGSLLFRQHFYDLFDPNDERIKLLDRNGTPNLDDPKGIWTTKWPRNTSEGNYMINVKVLRMSEAKLNRIEALYHLGDTATALAELNDFALSRGGNTYSGTDLLNEILTERRKEFFAEGQRFFDLKRNNLAADKMTNCGSGLCAFSADSKYFVLPIPQYEMIHNPNMTQHPLWQ